MNPIINRRYQKVKGESVTQTDV